MKISYNWLKEFLRIDLDAVMVGEILTDLGLEWFWGKIGLSG
jgi:phenylalanyl-tRNA synthetase beta chain